jgi:hypothetical protein
MQDITNLSVDELDAIALLAYANDPDVSASEVSDDNPEHGANSQEEMDGSR